MTTLRLGSRQSALARAQAGIIGQMLARAFPDLHVEMVFMTTTGDSRQAAAPRSSPSDQERLPVKPGEANLKAMFTKELEDALLDNRIDLAVHSLKDMSAELPAGLCLAAVPVRDDARDVWISRDGTPWRNLPNGARVGTGAVRRQAQLRRLLPEVTLVSLRGNIDTRLGKLEENNLHGIVLARAGLRRLGRDDAITDIFSTDDMLPAVGQGCLGIETRQNDAALAPVLPALTDADSFAAARAERALLQELGGSCNTPIAGHATVTSQTLELHALVASPDGGKILRRRDRASLREPEVLGRRVARALWAAGAGKLLQESA